MPDHSPLITGVDVVVTNPMQAPLGNFVLVRVTTDQDGLHGWGDATCSGSELAVVTMIEEHIAPALIGQPAGRIEHLWHTIYHLPYYRSGSVHLSAVSGIDMALWDIKGKQAGLPVCELLGGRVRDRMLTYRSVSGRTFDEVLEQVHQLQQLDYQVIKVQVAVPELESGYAVPASDAQQAATEEAFARGVPPAETWEPEPYTRLIPRLFDFLRAELGDSVQFDPLTWCGYFVTCLAVAYFLAVLFLFQDPDRDDDAAGQRPARAQATSQARPKPKAVSLPEMFAHIRESRWVNAHMAYINNFTGQMFTYYLCVARTPCRPCRADLPP